MVVDDQDENNGADITRPIQDSRLEPICEPMNRCAVCARIGKATPSRVARERGTNEPAATRRENNVGSPQQH